MSVRRTLAVFALLVPLVAPSPARAKGKRKGKLPPDPNNPAMRTLLGTPRPDHRLGLANGLESVWPGKPIADISLPEAFSRVDMYSAQHAQLTYEGIMTPLKFSPDPLDPDKVGSVQVAFPTVEDGLPAYFGRGRSGKGDSNPWMVWVDPAQRIRALGTDRVVSESGKSYAMTVVQFEPYWPMESILAELFGAAGAQGELEIGPGLRGLVAAKTAGVRDAKEDTVTVELPAIEFNWTGIARLRQRNQRVDAATYTFSTLADPAGVKTFLTKVCAYLPKGGTPCKAGTILKKRDLRIHDGVFGVIHVRIGDGDMRITRGGVADGSPSD